MKKQLTITLAVATAFAGYTFAATNVPESPNPHAVTSAINPGAKQDAVTAGDIHTTFVDLAADAVTPNHMDHLRRYFTGADQKQIENSGSYKANYGKTLDQTIHRLNANWKKTYGHDFNIRQSSGFKPDFYSIMQSTAGSNRELASEITVNSSISPHQLKSDQPIALATLKSMHGMPALTVPLIEEGGAWKINVPANEDASALRQNLVDQLSAVVDHSAFWPKDENAAYRMVTRHVLMAVLNQPVMHRAHAK